MERRDVLKAGGAFATVGMTGLAGCTSAIPFIGGGPASLGDTTDWLPAPDLIDSDLDNYDLVGVTAPSSVDEISDELDSGTWDSYQDTYVEGEYTNLVASEVDLVVQASLFSVVEGDIDGDAVESRLRDDLSRETSHRGYELYADENGSTGYAVTDGTLINASPGFGADISPENLLELVIDAEDGSVDRYVDESGDFSELVGELPGGHMALGSTFSRDDSELEGHVAYGRSQEIGEDESTVTEVLVFIEDVSEGARRDLEDDIDDDGQYDDYREGPDLDISGNIATIEGTVRTRDVEFLI